jgi:hypothetical protein
MLTLALIGQGLFVLGVLMFSARVTIRSRSVLKGTLCLYSLFVLCIILFAGAIPMFLHHAGVPSEVLADSFPEEIGIIPVILLGWIPAVMYAGLVRLVCFAGTRAKEYPQTPAPMEHTPGRVGFAPNDQIEALRPFVDEFWSEILGTSYLTSYVSNQSQLDTWERYVPGGRAALIERVKQRYGVDISEFYDEPLPLVLRRIREESAY